MTLDPDLARYFDDFNGAHKLQDSTHQTVISYLLMEPPRPASEAAGRSRAWAEDTCKTIQTITDYESAISDMIDRDLVWEIDAAKQSLIREYLSENPALEPTDCMPDIGTLQISIRFAKLLDELWAGINRERPGADWCRDWQSEKVHLVYCRARKNCFHFLRDELSDDETEIEYLCGPKKCGPWRCYWWQRYESGYVLEVHYA